MAYTDLTAVFVYRGLLTHQQMDQAAENDKVFNDLLTSVTDFANFLHFDNTKGVKGEVAATGSYKKLVVLDAGNVAQLGEAGTEVRVPADPTNALGVATKQYVDGVQMFQTQAIASAAASGLTTILNLTATTRVRLHAVWVVQAGGTSTWRVKITVDGTVVIDDTSATTLVAGDVGHLAANGRVTDDGTVDDGFAGDLIEICGNSTFKIEADANVSAGGASGTVFALYSKIP